MDTEKPVPAFTFAAAPVVVEFDVVAENTNGTRSAAELPAEVFVAPEIEPAAPVPRVRPEPPEATCEEAAEEAVT